MDTPQYLSRRDAAAYLTQRGLPVKGPTLAHWACTGRYSLPFHKLGRMIVYHPDDLDALIANARVEPGNGASRDRATAGGG